MVPESALLSAHPAQAAAVVDDILAGPDRPSLLAEMLGLQGASDLRQRAIEAIASGRWCAVTLETPALPGEPYLVDDPVEPPTPVEPPEPRPEVRTWIEVTIVDESGLGFPGSRWRLTTPDGDDVGVSLDVRSTFRLDGITETGTCHLRARDTTPDPSEPAPDAVVDAATPLLPPVVDASLPLVTGRSHVVLVPRACTEIVVLDETGAPEPDEWCEIRFGTRRQKRRTNAQGSIIVWHTRDVERIDVHFPLCGNDAMLLARSEPLEGGNP